jgi:hypothetical protein
MLEDVPCLEQENFIVDSGRTGMAQSSHASTRRGRLLGFANFL